LPDSDNKPDLANFSASQRGNAMYLPDRGSIGWLGTKQLNR